MSKEEHIGQVSLIVFSGNFDKVYYALAMSTATLALSIPTTILFTMEAVTALKGTKKNAGWRELSGKDGCTGEERDKHLIENGLAGFEELLASANELGAEILVCEMGLKSENISMADLRADIDYKRGGLVTFFQRSQPNSQTLFI